MKRKSTKKAKVEQVEICLENGQVATANFDGGDISGFGGLPIVAQIAEHFGIIKEAANCIKDTRAQKYITHTIENLLLQVVMLCCAGYSDEIDSNYFKADSILKFILGWEPNGEQNGASQASISRFMKDRTERDLKRLFSFFINFYIRIQTKTPKEIILDFDGSSVETYGRQQYIAFNKYYDCYMYYPLFVMDQHGWLIAPILRPGNVSDANITVAVLKVLVKRFRKAWPGVKIMFRGDAAFNDPEIMDWCEENEIDYTSGLKGNNSLHSKSKTTDMAVEREFRKYHGKAKFTGPNGGKEKHEFLTELSSLPTDERREAYIKNDRRQVRRYGGFWYRAGDGYGGKHKKWKKERKIVHMSKYTDRGLKRRYIVTSLEGLTNEQIYKNIYSARGGAELVIRSMKGLGAKKLNRHEALTNQFSLMIQTIAYNLFQLLKGFLPKELSNLSIETLIHEVVRIAVQVKVSTRRTWFRWTSCHRYKEQILQLFVRLNTLPKPA